MCRMTNKDNIIKNLKQFAGIFRWNKGSLCRLSPLLHCSDLGLELRHDRHADWYLARLFNHVFDFPEWRTISAALKSATLLSHSHMLAFKIQTPYYVLKQLSSSNLVHCQYFLVQKVNRWLLLNYLTLPLGMQSSIDASLHKQESRSIDVLPVNTVPTVASKSNQTLFMDFEGPHVRLWRTIIKISQYYTTVQAPAVHTYALCIWHNFNEVLHNDCNAASTHFVPAKCHCHLWTR